MTTPLLQKLTDISENNPFPEHFGDGTVLLGMAPNDIYQLGYATAFNACLEAVKEAEAGNNSAANRTAWMIERNSTLWGHEWFCAGEDRWTQDPNKTIQFPDRASAEEIWVRLLGEETKEFPYEELGGGGEWVYTISLTEHAWMGRSQNAL